MSWLAKEWKYRIPLSLINTGGANTLDGDWTINTDLGPYWRNSLANMNDTANLATGQANSVSISNALVPNIQLARPGGYSTPIIKCGRQRKGQLVTDKTIEKQTTETTVVWWDLRGCMQYRSSHNEQSMLLEEIAWAKVTCVDGNGVDATAAMVPAATVSFTNHHIVSHVLQAGGDDYFYLLTLTVGTDDGMGGSRVLDYRATVHVNDITVNNV